MSTDNHDEPLSFDDIDEILRPVTEIRLDNLPPDVLEHLVEQLGLIAHIVGLRINSQ
ncbi:hypothetical protein [Marinobacter nauticus]|uniref:hypothetical protein n=1 Tax=Marinobacter nauticus TaxID=2743 RepID=UPI001C993FF9|nr:hypothetical protein [Marinobacter nauticus]MBY5963767.1 hypothetical protein [Marinobacter nauticus]